MFFFVFIVFLRPNVVVTVWPLWMQESKPSLAVCALESLVTHSSHPQQLLTALRCLIRLTVTTVENGENKL